MAARSAGVRAVLSVDSGIVASAAAARTDETDLTGANRGNGERESSLCSLCLLMFNLRSSVDSGMFATLSGGTG